MSETQSPLSKSDKNLVWLDCEMTGLSPTQDRIIEIARVGSIDRHKRDRAKVGTRAKRDGLCLLGFLDSTSGEANRNTVSVDRDQAYRARIIERSQPFDDLNMGQPKARQWQWLREHQLAFLCAHRLGGSDAVGGFISPIRGIEMAAAVAFGSKHTEHAFGLA